MTHYNGHNRSTLAILSFLPFSQRQVRHRLHLQRSGLFQRPGGAEEPVVVQWSGESLLHMPECTLLLLKVPLLRDGRCQAEAIPFLAHSPKPEPHSLTPSSPLHQLRVSLFHPGEQLLCGEG